jgi:hypothetical protein
LSQIEPLALNLAVLLPGPADELFIIEFAQASVQLGSLLKSFPEA